MFRQPDYLGLVTLLPTLHRLVDAGGSVTLDPDEADRIRALGFHAQTGPWRVPRLPAGLVAGNPLLEPLGDDIDGFWKPSSGVFAEVPQVGIPCEQPAEKPDVANTMPSDAPSGPPSSTAASPVSPGAKTLANPAPACARERECAAILEAVGRAGGHIAKRLLQKKLWRIRAERFNHLIQSLVEREEIYVEGNMLLVQPVPQADSNQFPDVPQPDEDVPPGESAVGPEESAGAVNGIRGASRDSSPRKVIENAK